ncbi:hypothetical protein FJT64_012424 [Amphibalanus amphitrite]|uniref:CCHC-type domain-containing protein n=1 Tax=Amphibalanus amphitrite TaxID=1232801 RepID=A0A6A4V842_AMPAM|nr:hypothetical protein FJT64_012424 [Amphibalanus amphitrite]
MEGDSISEARGLPGLTSQRGRQVTLTEEGRQFQIDIKQKKYQKDLKELKKGVDIIKRLEVAGEEENETLKEAYIQWKRTYIDLVQTSSELQGLLSEVDLQQHLSRHQDVMPELNTMKAEMEKKLEPTHKTQEVQPSVASSRCSVRSKISLLRLEDAQRRAELEARAAAAKKRLQMERQKQELQWKMQELELDTEREILKAKQGALLKFEEEEGMCAPGIPIQRSKEEEDAMRASELPVPKSKLEKQEASSKIAVPGQAKACKESETSNDPSPSTAADVLSSLVSVLKDQNKQSHLLLIEPGVFSGSIDKFPLWLKAFETYVEHRTSSPVERLHFLSRYTEGDAHSAIAGFLHLRTSDAYVKAKEKLVARYGNDFLIASSYLKRLREWSAVKSGDSKGLQRLADFLEHCHMASSAIPGMRALDDPHTIQMVLKKLPVYIADRWKRLVDSSVYGPTPHYPSFADFVQLVSTEGRIACGPVSSGAQSEESPSARNIRGKAHAFTSSHEKCEACGHQSEEQRATQQVTTARAVRRPCVICTEPHDVHTCKKFMALRLDERKEEVMKKRLCRGCLKPGHIWRDCRRRDKCDKCQMSHPTLLHDDKLMKTTASAGSHDKTSSGKQHGGDTQVKASSLRSTAQSTGDVGVSNCHTMIVPVKLYHESQPEQPIITYALLDPQSDASFVTEALCDVLQPESTEVELQLSTLNGRKIVRCSSASGLVVESSEGGPAVNLPTLYSRHEIPADRELIPRRETCLKWPHLRQVAEKMPEYHADAEIGLLLGVNCPRIIKPREVIPGEEDDPWAVRTLLGWGIVGCVSEGEPTGCFYVGTGSPAIE